MAGKFLGLFKACRGKKKKDPGAAPAQQPEDPEQIQTLQDDAAQDKTQEQEAGRGRFRKTLKTLRKFLCIQHRNTSTTAAEGPGQPDSGMTKIQTKPHASPKSTAHTGSNTMDSQGVKAMSESLPMRNTDTRTTQGITNTATMTVPIMIHAPPENFLEESAVPSQQQVPAIVRRIHQRLLSHVAVDARLQIDIVRLAEEHPDDLVLTLLRCAPTCDRGAAIMWKTIASSGIAVEKVLPTLLCVMDGWPLQKMYTSDGDNKDVFALAATRAIWEILRLPCCPKPFVKYSPHLLVALLCQVFVSTEQMSEEVNTFWKKCQEENGLPANPNSFVVSTVKALFHHLHCLELLMVMERKCAWDTLLRADTHHFAVGLLAREMRRVCLPFCSCIALRLLCRLSREEPCWELPALAFLVEVLDGLDLSEWGNCILEILTRHLQSESMEMRHLALRGLVVLSKDPAMAKKMCSLSQSLLELLRNEDIEVVKMSLSVFTNILLNKDVSTSCPTAPKLAEALRPLFDSDNSHVQRLSISLYQDVMESVVEKGKKGLVVHVSESLLPLFFHCHDENRRVAQVPAIVRRIHQRLLSHVAVDARLQIDIVRLAEEHPDDLVLTLLRCAPTCDRAATMIWRAIGSSGPAVEKVLPTLLCVMADWPVHSTCTSDGDDRNVFALAATLAIWVIVQVPECHEAMSLYSSRLFVALLFHVAITTQQMPPVEASTFWRACQEEHRLPSKPNRFAVQAMKALLCRLQCDHVVLAMERKRGWDTLLCADSQHYAVGLLAREMRRDLIPLCSRIALHLLQQLNRQDPHWDLPFLAFLVEVLEFLDLRECGGNVFRIMARYLHSKCRERRRLALRGLVVLSKDLLMDNSHVQVLSIHLFCKVMQLVVDEGKKALKTIVSKSMCVLVIYCQAENCHVAKASRETLLGVARFLKRRKLEELLKKQPPLNVYECLVPAIVRRIHQRLLSHVAVDARLQIDIVRLAEEHPDDLVLTLLRCAPTCDRFAVQAMKALLCRLQCDHVVLAMERKRGWDTLLCADSQHYAVGLLAREMRRDLIPLCSRIALHLLQQLNRQDPHWDLPFLAFLVEVLEFLDLRECGGNVFRIMARYLHSKCRERRRLALRGLVVLSKDLLMDNSHVQVLSIHLFCKVMQLVVDEGKKALKTIVSKSMCVLVIYCQAENCHVAKASRETLLGVARFLKRRKLEELLKKQPPLNVYECLLAETEHLRRALRCPESPQERRPSGSWVSHEPPLPPRPAAARPQPRPLPWQRQPGPAPWSPGWPRRRCRPLAAVPWGGSVRQGPGLSPAGPAGCVATAPAAPLAGSCAAGAVTGSVFTGIGGQCLREKREELQAHSQGECGQRAVSGGWRGELQCPGRELQSLCPLRWASLPVWMRGGVGRAQSDFRDAARGDS
ncbi:unnamed protein product [Coccothraustes coccothraustes]